MLRNKKSRKPPRRNRAAARPANGRAASNRSHRTRAAAPHAANRKVHLTEREQEIFRLLSLGCTVKEVAAILRIAPSTADNHKARLMGKLGIGKSAILTRLALKMGISSMSDRLTRNEQRRSGRKEDGWN